MEEKRRGNKPKSVRAREKGRLDVRYFLGSVAVCRRRQFPLRGINPNGTGWGIFTTWKERYRSRRGRKRERGGLVEGARKRGRWEWSILDNSRILLAGIPGSLLHKDHSLPLLQRTRSCTDVLSFCLSFLFTFSPRLSCRLSSLFIAHGHRTPLFRYIPPIYLSLFLSPSVSSFIGQLPSRRSSCSSGSSAPSLRLFSLVPSACPSRLLYEAIMYRIRYHLITILGIEKSLVVTVRSTSGARTFIFFFPNEDICWLLLETFARHVCSDNFNIGKVYFRDSRQKRSTGTKSKWIRGKREIEKRLKNEPKFTMPIRILCILSVLHQRWRVESPECFKWYHVEWLQWGKCFMLPMHSMRKWWSKARLSLLSGYTDYIVFLICE